jgi:hypothetical protein
MLFLIRFIQNAVDIYSLILIVFALMSWFPNAYESRFGRLIISLVKPIMAPLQRLPLQIAGLDLSVWIAVLLVHFLGEQLIRLLVIFL